MKRWIGGLALLLATSGVAAAAPARGAVPVKRPMPVVARLVHLGEKEHEAKPPIVITLVPGPVVARGRQRARVWVRPLVDGVRLEVNVVTRAGLALAAGRHRWQSTARGETAQSEEVTLATDGPGERRIIIVATLYFADGTSVSGVEAYILNPAASPRATPPGSREIVLPSGEKVLEIPVQPG